MLSIDTMKHICKEKKVLYLSTDSFVCILITFYMEMTEYAYDLVLILNMEEVL